MRKLLLLVIATFIILSLPLVGCGRPPGPDHVGPVGPQGSVGPQGDVGPQSIEGLTPANVTVIEDTNIFITREYSFSSFTRLEISDGFDVMIAKGTGHQVSTKFEEAAIPYIVMFQQDDTLNIMLEHDRTYHMVNITLDVDIMMPELTEIILNDGAGATITGLTGFKSEVDFLSELNY